LTIQRIHWQPEAEELTNVIYFFNAQTHDSKPKRQSDTL